MKTDNEEENCNDDELLGTGIAVGGTIVCVTLAAVAPLVLAAAGVGLVVLALFADKGGGGEGGGDDSPGCAQ